MCPYVSLIFFSLELTDQLSWQKKVQKLSRLTCSPQNIAQLLLPILSVSSFVFSLCCLLFLLSLPPKIFSKEKEQANQKSYFSFHNFLFILFDPIFLYLFSFGASFDTCLSLDILFQSLYINRVSPEQDLSYKKIFGS